MRVEDKAEALWRQWDELGEQAVRDRWAAGFYQPEQKPIFDEWLRKLDQAVSEVDKQQQENWRSKELKVADSAKNAAWVAAIVAILSLLVSAVALCFALRK